jgi:N-acetylmuramoyl-L-alanine amidase
MRTIEVNDPLLRQIRYAENSPGTARVVLDLNESCHISTSQLANPARLVIELRTRKPTAPEVQVSRSGVMKEGLDGSAAVSAPPVAPVTASPSVPANPTTIAATPPAGPKPSASPRPSEQRKSPAGQPNSAAEQSKPTPDRRPSPADGTTVATNQASDAPPASASEVRPAQPSAMSPATPVTQASAAPVAATSADAPDAPAIPVASATPITPATPVAPGASAQQATGETTPSASPTDVASAKPATRTVTGRQSLVRALGLKIGRVVIDPGHGGKDHGTTGVSGLREKDLVLDVSLRLASLVRDRLGSEVVLTREDDTFISLEERTTIANRSRADLFLSIHANSSPYKLASGAETFFLNFTSSREAMDVAARENASSQRSVAELQDIVRKITLKDKRDESEDFAARIQSALFRTQRTKGIATKNRGVKAAPFIVLVGAEMPSVLVEIGFLSNAKEEAELKKPEYRQQIAEALLKGLETYMDSLSHFEGSERAATRE